MHPFTEDRLKQEEEYQECLRVDQEREEREAINRAIAESLAEVVEADVDGVAEVGGVAEVDEESLREEEERPLTIEELRAVRMAYYEPSVQCDAITLSGSRCKNVKIGKYNRFCKIHSKRCPRWTTTCPPPQTTS